MSGCVFTMPNVYFVGTRTSARTALLMHSCLQVTDALQAAQDLGLTVIRTWAFNDGSKAPFPLQPQPGQLDAFVFR